MKGMNWNKVNKNKNAKKLTKERESEKATKKLYGYDVMNAASHKRKAQKWVQIFGSSYTPKTKKYNFENGKIDVNKVQEALKSTKSSVVDDKEK